MAWSNNVNQVSTEKCVTCLSLSFFICFKNIKICLLFIDNKENKTKIHLFKLNDNLNYNLN